jgi:hypothetical protein
MAKILSDFVSRENRNYKFKLGRTLASSLAGFVAGAIAASIVWYIAFTYIITTK